MDTTGNICTNATGGGGGSAITAPLGHATADVAAIAVVPSATASFPVTGTFWQATQPVSGTFWQATQPISAASLPLPTGAALDASLATLHTDLGTLNTTASSSLPAGAALIGKFGIDQTTPGTTNLVSTTPVNGDPCQTLAPHYVAINLTTSTQIIAGTSAKKTYICKISLVPGAAVNVALVEGTGSVCATNIYGLEGGTTAGTGWNFVSAGNGIIEGNGIASAIGPPDADANATAANLCLLLSGAVQVSGQVKYVQN